MDAVGVAVIAVAAEAEAEVVATTEAIRAEVAAATVDITTTVVVATAAEETVAAEATMVVVVITTIAEEEAAVGTTRDPQGILLPTPGVSSNISSDKVSNKRCELNHCARLQCWHLVKAND